MDWMNQAALSAQKSDAVFFYVFGLSVVFLIFITTLMIYFVVRYSKKRHPKAEQIEGHLGLEIVWTTIPLVLFLSIFYYGWTNYEYMRLAPRDAMAVRVTVCPPPVIRAVIVPAMARPSSLSYGRPRLISSAPRLA